MDVVKVARLVFSKRTCSRVYAILALLTKLFVALLLWVLEVPLAQAWLHSVMHN